MPPKPLHLRRGDVVTRGGRQSRVETVRTAGCPARNATTAFGVLAVPVHAHPEASSCRAAPASVEGRGTAPIAFWWKRERVRRCSASSHDHRATDDVGVPADVLRRRVHARRRRRGSEASAGTAWRRSLSTTSNAPASCATDGDRLDVADVEQRVGRGLHPHQPGLPGRIAARTASRSLAGAGSSPQPRLGGDLVEEPEGAAVGVVGEHHVVARAAQRPDHGVLRRQPTGEREPALPLLQGGDVALEGGAGRVGGAAVLVAAAQSPPPTPSCW